MMRRGRRCPQRSSSWPGNHSNYAPITLGPRDPDWEEATEDVQRSCDARWGQAGDYAVITRAAAAVSAPGESARETGSDSDGQDPSCGDQSCCKPLLPSARMESLLLPKVHYELVTRSCDLRFCIADTRLPTRSRYLNHGQLRGHRDA